MKRLLLCALKTASIGVAECRKVYQVLADTRAAKLGQGRVVDESGEDCLYLAEYSRGKYIVPIQLPQAGERVVL